MPSAVKAGSRYMAAKPRSPSARTASSIWAAYRCTHPSSPRRYGPRYPSGAGIVATWAGRSRCSYVWVGVLTVAVVVILALLGAGLIRRQAAVAQLRNDLLANVTHELKTPLASMRLLVDTLVAVAPVCTKNRPQYLQLIAAENLRLSRLIDNFPRPSPASNEINGPSTSARPRRGILSPSRRGRRARTLHRADCHFELPGPRGFAAGHWPIRAHGHRAGELAGQCLQILRRPEGNPLARGGENGDVTFAVQDNGIGVPTRETRRIFRRFYQVDQRLARDGRGLRFGLEHCAIHRDRPSWDRAGGKRTRPRQHLCHQPAAGPRRRQRIKRMNGARILIIEDEPALLRGLKDNFETEGYEVRTAQNGERGLEALLHDPPDLLLLDLMLPKVNGYEICRTARARQLDLPIIMLTAKGQEEDIVRGLELGADDYVTKPFSIRELLARVKALLRRGGGRRRRTPLWFIPPGLDSAQTVSRPGGSAADGQGIPPAGVFFLRGPDAP